MTKPRAFISFDFDNNEVDKILFVGQLKNSRSPIEIEDWSSKESLPQSIWERKIEEKIRKCHMLIVLVGRQIRTATGIHKEIDMAIRNNVPVFGVYVDGASIYTSLPLNLKRSSIVEWNWRLIEIKIDEMMQQGKNKGSF